MNKLRKQIIALLKKMIEVATALLKKKKSKNYCAFREALGQRESSGNYKAVNTLGFLGKYQFGLARLCDLGYTKRKSGTTGFSNKSFVWKKPYSQEVFLGNPNIQDKIFQEHIKDLIKQIDKRFKKTTIKKHTYSGMCAFAHIAGIGGLMKFVKYGIDPQDAYGTRASSYLKKFAGYDLESLV